jgi:internalin A
MEEGSISLDVANTLRQLGDLRTNKIVGVPPEVLSDHQNDNCLPRLRAWKDDLAAGEEKDQEVKVFLLGNGTAGKTQLCRRLRGLGFDASIPSTHAVQFTKLQVMPDAGSGAVKARLWDFGGQDIYHGTHALFLEGRAVFVLVWNPEVEAAGAYEEGGLSLHHHSLTYWLDYVRSLAGEDAAIVVAQSKCDRETDRATPKLPVNHGFKRPPATVTCSAKEGELDELKAALRSATRYLLEVHGSYRLPTSWVAVKERLRTLRLTQKTMARETFEALCRETHGTSVPAALLTYLHRCGEVFYKESLFKDEIVLDQEWAVRAIYAVLDRQGACQQLRQMGGIFPAGLLNTLAWQGEYTVDEQKTLVGMMESCSIAFPLSEGYDFNARWMAVPDLLPLEKEVQDRVQALWHEGVPVETVTLEYDFLHAGILREFLCQIGQQGGTNAAYWRYGCCFYDAKTRSRARVRAQLTATSENPGRGVILIETCEGESSVLLEQVQEAILNIRLGPKPRVVRPDGAAEAPERSAEPSGTLQESLNIQPAPTERPLVYLSYAWGGEKEKLVDRLEARLIQEGYEVKRDKRAMRPGDWITDFMREIERAKKVCVVLSEKYLKSMYCMRELFGLYQRTSGDKAEFLTRIVPLVLEDAPISKTTDRLKHVRHWQTEQQALNDELKGIEPCNQGDAATELRLITDISLHAELMLRHASDYLLPRGIADIEKDDFAAVLEALKRKG